MDAVTRVRSLRAAALAALIMVIATPAGADLRISDLDVFLNDHELTVNVAVLGAIAPALHEGLQSGIPSHVRYTVELWQYNRYWRDSRLLTKVVERQLAYNVVTKEYKVTTLGARRAGRTSPATCATPSGCCPRCAGSSSRRPSTMDPAEVIYVRVHAEAALNGENSFVTRMAGTAEQAVRQSDYRTMLRVQ